MKKGTVDYSQFRLSRINEPKYRHLWLLTGWIGFLLLYYLTENFIPPQRLHVIHCALDDIIPFNEYFLIFYGYWYFLVYGALIYYLRVDVLSFKRLQVYIIITQLVAMAVYIIYPSVQHLRPASFERDNLLTRLMAFIYKVDTPTGVCPSLHVAYSLGIASVCCHRRSAKLWVKWLMILSAILISISTAFVKQHSVVDIFMALPLGLLAEYLVFGNTPLRRWIET